MNRPATDDAHLPRVVYTADVPVADTRAGPMIVHRLFSHYPPDRLFIFGPRDGKAELPAVQYLTHQFNWPLLVRRALPAVYRAAAEIHVRRLPRGLRARIERFRPEAVVTVAHHTRWINAALIARRFRLPLHIIVHDDFMFEHSARLQDEFGETYRRAASRLCISPFMEEAYRKRYGAAGTVLYPPMAPDILPAVEPAVRQTDVLSFVFAGSVSGGALEVLEMAARAIAAEGHRLTIYTFTPPMFQAEAFRAPGIRVAAALPVEDLRRVLSEDADVLLLPGSYLERDRGNMALLFPSKLTDYAVAGKPLMIFAPAYSSIYRWASEHGTAAGIVSEQSLDLVRAAVRACVDVDRRTTSAQNLIDFASNNLTHAAVTAAFMRTLTEGHARGRGA
jgi:hypothetical protein